MHAGGRKVVDGNNIGEVGRIICVPQPEMQADRDDEIINKPESPTRAISLPQPSTATKRIELDTKDSLTEINEKKRRLHNLIHSFSKMCMRNKSNTIQLDVRPETATLTPIGLDCCTENPIGTPLP